jgi:hypothetical protein
MSRTRAETAVAVLPLELGGELRILTEDVDVIRGTVRWQVQGPHIRGVVWLAGEAPPDLDDPDPGKFRCRMYSGDYTGQDTRQHDPIRDRSLTCYRAKASVFRLGYTPRHLHALAAEPIPELDTWGGTTSAADRRTVDVRRALARRALSAPWLQQLQWTWRLQAAAKIASRAGADLAKALGQIESAQAHARYAQSVLDDLAADTAEAAACGIRPLASNGRELFGAGLPAAG